MLHSIAKERLELVNSMTEYVTERVLPVLKPVERCWQPADFLPAPESDTFIDEVRLGSRRWNHKRNSRDSLIPEKARNLIPARLEGFWRSIAARKNA